MKSTEVHDKTYIDIRSVQHSAVYCFAIANIHSNTNTHVVHKNITQMTTKQTRIVI